MRTGQDTEFIVTEFVTPTTQNAYILVAIQSCKFTIDEEIAGDEEEAKEWLKLPVFHRIIKQAIDKGVPAGWGRGRCPAWLSTL